MVGAAVCLIVHFSCLTLHAQYYLPSATEILWEVTNQPPKNLWTYRVVPCSFSPMVLSNALALASLQATNRVSIPKDKNGFLSFQDRPAQLWSRALTFEPRQGEILFHRRTVLPKIPEDVPEKEAVSRLARQCASLLGIDAAELVEKAERTQKCSSQAGGEICARGVLFTRLLNGIEFYANGEDVRGGFLIDFGSFGTARLFNSIWPTAERSFARPFPAQTEITGWIKAGKAVMEADQDGSFDFARLNDLSAAPKLIITKVTPYYDEVTPQDPDAAILIAPFLKLDVIGQCDTKRITGHLLCLIAADGSKNAPDK